MWSTWSACDATAVTGGSGAPDAGVANGQVGGAERPPAGGPAPGTTPESGAEGGASGLPADAGAGRCESFGSSFEAIQRLLFEQRGCTAQACHGEAKLGGLDLRAELAWENLVGARSSNSSLARIQPGAPAQSFLYLKLRAATEPGSVQVAGSPMPIGTAALTPGELKALRVWIAEGAPRTGKVSAEPDGTDVASLLDACPSPQSMPVKAEPLPPPAADQGIQLRLPQYLLEAQSEVENCTPFAFDFSDAVPAEYKDVARNVMYVNGSHVRQDPQSHHLILWDPAKDLSSIADGDPDWTCRGGPDAGKPCSAQNANSACGAGGVCAGKTTPGSLCGIETLAFGSGTPQDIIAGLLGLGPKQLTLEDLLGFGDLLLGAGMPAQIANAQAAEQYVPPIEGIYMELPLRGVLWFNSHAFNLTEQDTALEARVNWYYAKRREREMRRLSNSEHNDVADGQAPFTRQTYCAKHEVPQGYSLAIMTGHTHRRGEHFWVNDASGQTIYENFDYKDPAYTEFEPWIAFDSADAAARTLEFCATYNNGVKQDGSPDLELVTRASRMPARATCTPVACVAGKIGAACKTDRDCDSAAGAGDGDCDACPIEAGQTTENEMFVLTGWYVLPPQR